MLQGDAQRRCVVCGRGREQVQALVFVRSGHLCDECAAAAHALVRRELNLDSQPLELAKKLAQAINHKRRVLIDLGPRQLEGVVKGIKYQYLYGTTAVTWVLFEELDGAFSQLNVSLIRQIQFKAEPEVALPEDEDDEPTAPVSDVPLGEALDEADEPQGAIAALERQFAKREEPGHFGESLGAYLVRLGMITEEQLNTALREQRKVDLPLGPLLVKLGFVTGNEARKVLELQYGIPFSDVRALKVDDAVLAMLPAETIRRHRVLPIRFQNEILTVAMVNPKDGDALDGVRYHLNGVALDVRIMAEEDFASFVAERLGA